MVTGWPDSMATTDMHYGASDGLVRLIYAAVTTLVELEFFRFVRAAQRRVFGYTDVVLTTSRVSS